VIALVVEEMQDLDATGALAQIVRQARVKGMRVAELGRRAGFRNVDSLEYDGGQRRVVEDMIDMEHDLAVAQDAVRSRVGDVLHWGTPVLVRARVPHSDLTEHLREAHLVFVRNAVLTTRR
jgi:hypothetical protein